LLFCRGQRGQDLVDPLNPFGPADHGGGCQAVAENLAGLFDLVCGDQQLAQCQARESDPVRAVQLAEDLERLDQPGDACLVVLAREVDLGQAIVGCGDPVEVAELPVASSRLSCRPAAWS
jgi:hypothetical protein